MPGVLRDRTQEMCLGSSREGKMGSEVRGSRASPTCEERAFPLSHVSFTVAV